jgi:hypothetical protein
MPMWGTGDNMREMMRRHEAEGLGAFSPDDSEMGRILVETTLPGGKRWVSPCGCAVSIPGVDDASQSPTFLAVAEHFEWSDPTDRERAIVASLDAKVIPRSRLGRWVGRKHR